MSHSIGSTNIYHASTSAAAATVSSSSSPSSSLSTSATDVTTLPNFVVLFFQQKIKALEQDLATQEVTFKAIKLKSGNQNEVFSRQNDTAVKKAKIKEDVSVYMHAIQVLSGTAQANMTPRASLILASGIDFVEEQLTKEEAQQKKMDSEAFEELENLKKHIQINLKSLQNLENEKEQIIAEIQKCVLQLGVLKSADVVSAISNALKTKAHVNIQAKKEELIGNLSNIKILISASELNIEKDLLAFKSLFFGYKAAKEKHTSILQGKKDEAANAMLKIDPNGLYQAQKLARAHEVENQNSKRKAAPEVVSDDEEDAKSKSEPKTAASSSSSSAAAAATAAAPVQATDEQVSAHKKRKLEAKAAIAILLVNLFE